MRDAVQELEDHQTVIVGLLLVAVVLVLLSPVIRSYASFLGSPQQARVFMESFGVLAPLAYVLLHIVQIVFAPIPGQFIYIAGGYVFGVVDGTLYGFIGTVIGSGLAILVGDRLGRPVVKKIVSDASIDRFDAAAATYGYTPYFLIFLLPGFPDDAVCLIGGVTSLDAKKLWGFALIGRTPELIALTLAGNSLAVADTTLFAVLMVVVFVVSLLALLFRQRILHYSRHDSEQRIRS